jgi:hypothetical protein
MNDLYPAQEPPEYPGIEGALKILLRENWEMRHEVASLKTSLSLQTYNLSEIARLLHISESKLRNQPWNVPNYGKADIGLGSRRWFHDTVTAWYHIPETERRAKWESMKSADRRKAMGEAS